MPDAFDWSAELRARLAKAELDPAREAEIVDELAQHLEDQCAELMGGGRTIEQARRELLAQLDDPASGFPDRLLERHWAVRTATPARLGGRPTARGMLASIWYDLRYGARGLARAPGMTAVIVLSLGVVIGANTAIFGLLDALLLRPLPLPHPEQLVTLRPMNNGYKAELYYSDYQTLIRTPGLPKIEGYSFDPAIVATGTDTTDLWVESVTGGYFDLLGAPPLLGRTVLRNDDATNSRVVVVSEAYWRQHLGGRNDVIGKPLLIDDQEYTLIGVMPKTYHDAFFAHQFTMAVPFSTGPFVGEDRTLRSVALIARLPHGTRDIALSRRLTVAYRQCCVEAPIPSTAMAAPHQPRTLPTDPPIGAFGFWEDASDTTPHIQVVDASRGITWHVDFRAQYRPVLLAMMAGVLVLLLIACANTSTLLLARAAARQREFAVRLSLGASRARMLRQLMTETLELALLGVGLGLVLAWIGTVMLLHELPSNALQLGDVIAWHVTPAILAFTVLVLVGCTLVVGVWPARRATSLNLQSVLSGSQRAARHGRHWSPERVLATLQITMALVLASAAALFVATLHNLERGDGGYHTRQLLLARLDLRYSSLAKNLPNAAQTMLDAVQRLPGVDAASISISAPVINDLLAQRREQVPGYVPTPNERPPRFNAVSPRFFTTTGIGLVAGREFGDHDVVNSEPVVIISQAFAHHYFNGKNPIGRSLTGIGHDRHSARIIGIARDAQYDNLRAAPTAVWYAPLYQERPTDGIPSFILSVRTEIDPVSLATSVRHALGRVASDVDIRQLTSVGQLLDDALARERFAAGLASFFGAIALGLCALGVYGVIAQNVAARTTEIGVRMALGATPRDALWIAMRQSLTIAGVGLAIGIPLAFAANRAIDSQLYGVAPSNPGIMMGVACSLAIAAALAGLLPGRRAASVDPAVALRAD